MRELIFIVDPMCSWCWGFHPVMEALRQKHSKEYNFSLIMGGLRTSGEMEWNRKNKDYLQDNWEAVQKQTGQEFSAKILTQTTFDYDTYPACKAVVTVRNLWGEDASFNYLNNIQEAFYTRGEDITSLNILIKYIEDTEKFLELYESEKAELLMHHDFSKTRSMGANAFPSVAIIDKDGHMSCQQGYHSLEEILTF